MLIRSGVIEDKAEWIKLAKEVAPVFRVPDMADNEEFQAYVIRALKGNKAIVAMDRMTDACLGIISFSRKHNSIAWFGVFEKHRGKGVGGKLLNCAINQLDWNQDINVETYPKDYAPGIPARKVYEKYGFRDTDELRFDEYNNLICKMTIPANDRKKGHSFHYHFDTYTTWADKAHCPVCQKQEPPYPPVLIKELDYSWVECHPEAQGKLFGKCHVLSKQHSEHFYDMAREDMANFMTDVQKAAQALHQVTGAVKVNYEIHGNSMPHLHVHLFPRYLDDDFPSAPIDYRLTEPSPYESEEAFKWFIQKMQALL